MTANPKIKISESFTFDDLLLIPDYSDFLRDDVDLSISINSVTRLNLPIVSSPMDTVTTSKMAKAMSQKGGLGIIHRNLSINDQIKEVKLVKESKGGEAKGATVDSKGSFLVGAAIGIGSDMPDRAKGLIEAGADLLLIDSAHGHTKALIEATKYIKDNFPEAILMSGNVVTTSGAKALIEAGADILRVGVGPGSICTTRIVTGVGVPQLTALQEVLKATKGTDVKVCADGGIKQIGDIAKALAMGADMVMLGSLLAGFDESPGEIIEMDGNKYKSYRGMGSVAAMKAGSNARYGQKSDPQKMVAEGVEAHVRYKGKVEDFLDQVEGGLRGSCFYTGCQNISKLQEKAKFVKISTSGLKESHPHTVSVAHRGKSYL